MLVNLWASVKVLLNWERLSWSWLALFCIRRQLVCWLRTGALGKPQSHCNYWLHDEQQSCPDNVSLASSRVAWAFSHGMDRGFRKRTEVPTLLRPQNWHSITSNVFGQNKSQGQPRFNNAPSLDKRSFNGVGKVFRFVCNLFYHMGVKRKRMLMVPHV